MSEALLSVENEGLRREIARLNRDCEDWNGKHQLACLEIERLRAALERLTQSADPWARSVAATALAKEGRWGST